MKKLLSMVLALVMVLGLCVIPTWADGPATTAPTPTYDWYDPSETVYTLDSMEDYLGFVKLTQGTVTVGGTTYPKSNFVGKTVNLRCDVDFAGMDFLKIDAAGNVISDWGVETFYGTFDATKDAATGENYTIKNLTCTINDSRRYTYLVGLFVVVDGIIQNLNVENIIVNSVARVGFGGIAVQCPKNRGVLDGFYNCHVSNITLDLTSAFTSSYYIGGLAGSVGDYKEVKNCSVSDFVVTAPNVTIYRAGGLIGTFYIGSASPKAGVLDDCHVDGFTINVAGLTHGNGDIAGIGGMLGRGYDGNDNYAFPITDCTVKGVNITVGTMYEHSYIGGFMGASRRRYEATNCSAEGAITVGDVASGAANCYVGGFCGSSTGAARNGGGWTQDSNGAALSFTNCSARVDITAGGACTIGGFAGLAGNLIDTTKDYVKFINCTSGGTLNATATTVTVGGFAGKDTDRGTYDACGNGGRDASGGTLPFLGARTTPFTDENSRTADMPNQSLGGGVNPYQVFSAPVTAETPTTITIDLSKKAFQPTREGYKFVGWSDTEGGAALTGPISVTLGGNEENPTTYYALWELIPVETPPADEPVPAPEPEPDQEPSAPAHEPIRRQHTTAVEDTTPDTDTTKADDTAKTDTVTSAQTFDAGIAVYGAMAVASLLGMGYVGKKKF